VHELLRHITPDSTEQELRWRHVLRSSEVPWLIDHKLQDQIVFPAAAYVATALEAAMAVCRRKLISASLVELSDVEFGRALVFDDPNSSVEIIVSLTDIMHLGSDMIQAHFKFHGSDGKGDGSLSLFSTGRVTISIGDPFDELLPARGPKPPNLVKAPAENFYAASGHLDYQWASSFAGLDKLERKLGYCTGYINVSEPP
jgi:hybrid polyketide synthase / nonribosomal peptide synthetase ACE1